MHVKIEIAKVMPRARFGSAIGIFFFRPKWLSVKCCIAAIVYTK